jgi:hypothetical protein
MLKYSHLNMSLLSIWWIPAGGIENPSAKYFQQDAPL